MLSVLRVTPPMVCVCVCVLYVLGHTRAFVCVCVCVLCVCVMRLCEVCDTATVHDFSQNRSTWGAVF